MRRLLQKKKSTPKNFEDINIENKAKNEIEIDYMKYFFDGIKMNSELRALICKNLTSYSAEELNKLATEVLSVSCGFLRYSSQIIVLDLNRSFFNFHFAIIWHLSDSIHNIPRSLNQSNLNEPFRLAGYLSEFFMFIYLLKQFDNKALVCNYERYYVDLNIRKEWEHLYAEQNVI